LEIGKVGQPPEEDEGFILYPCRLKDIEDLESIRRDSDSERVEKKFFDELKSLSEEALQLTEFLSEDKRLSHEICSLLKDSMGRLDLTVEVPVKALPFLEKVERILLNSHCHLIIVDEDEKIESMDLEEYPSEVVLMVVWNIIPKLKILLSEYTKRVKLRVEYFDKISRDLRSLQGTFDFSAEAPVEDLYQDQRTNTTLFKP
jgi:hypothetical protein